MVLLEITALFLNEEWLEMTEAEQENLNEESYLVPQKCMINPSYITCVEPALDKPGYIYVYVADRQYPVKSTMENFNSKVKQANVNLFNIN